MTNWDCGHRSDESTCHVVVLRAVLLLRAGGRSGTVSWEHREIATRINGGVRNEREQCEVQPFYTV